MKKVIRLAALTLVVAALTVACKSKAENVEDTLPADTMMVEEVVDSIDTIAAEVAEEVVEAATTVKKAAVKKANESGLSNAAKQGVQTTKTAEEQAAGKLSRGAARNSGVTAASENKASQGMSAEQNAVGKLNRK